MTSRAKKLIWIAPLAILGMALFAALGGQVVKLLWNGLMPTLFGLHPVTFWQALGLLALSRILVGGFGLGHSSRSRARGRVAERVEERCAGMPPEEREQFRQRMRERWGLGAAGGEHQTKE